MLSRDFKEFIALLNEHEVRYLVVGGYAVAFHGYPRYTKDIDVWVELSPENAARIVRALEEFGFGSLGLDTGDFLESDQIIQLGYPPNRIDILTTLKGITFDECYKVLRPTIFDFGSLTLSGWISPCGMGSLGQKKFGF